MIKKEKVEGFKCYISMKMLEKPRYFKTQFTEFHSGLFFVGNLKSIN